MLFPKNKQFFVCFSQKLAVFRVLFPKISTGQKNSTDWSARSARFCNSDKYMIHTKKSFATHKHKKYILMHKDAYILIHTQKYIILCKRTHKFIFWRTHTSARTHQEQQGHLEFSMRIPGCLPSPQKSPWRALCTLRLLIACKHCV